MYELNYLSDGHLLLIFGIILGFLVFFVPSNDKVAIYCVCVISVFVGTLFYVKGVQLKRNQVPLVEEVKEEVKLNEEKSNN